MNDNEDKTLLAIDYGTRRIGLAKSDSMGIIAYALMTLEIKSSSEGIKKLNAVIDEYQPQGIVVGYPLLASGDKSKKCKEIDNFIKKLQNIYKGPIHKVDEGYSSKEAENIIHAHGKKIRKDKKRIDRLAAVIILQRFLEEQTT